MNEMTVFECPRNKQRHGYQGALLIAANSVEQAIQLYDQYERQEYGKEIPELRPLSDIPENKSSDDYFRPWNPLPIEGLKAFGEPRVIYDNDMR
jgi:hypothetical protein